MTGKTLWQLVAAAGLGIFLSLGYLFLPQNFYALDDRLRDFLFILRGELPHNNHVIIVNIDEKSLNACGRWPWPRHKVAALLDAITAYQPGIIGMDVIFPEADNTSPHRIANALNVSQEALPDYDKTLAETLKNTPVIGGYLFLFEGASDTPAPMIASVIVQRGGRSEDFIPNPQSVLLNIPVLQDAYYSSGFLNNIPDNDGIVRSVPLLMNYQGQNYLSLSMEMLRIYYNASVVEIYNTDAGVTTVVMGEKSIPTDRFGKLHVNFRGGSKHFNYVSAVDVMEKRLPDDMLKGKFVLLGSAALGLGDIHATPYESTMAGVEVHANVIDNIIENDFIHAPIDNLVHNIIIIFATVFVTIALFSFLHRKYMAAGFVILLSGLCYFFYSMLFTFGIVLNILFPLLAFFLGVIAALLIDYVFEAVRVIEKEHELSAANELMFVQSKSAAMGEMVGMIAHQWRQPLSSVSAISSKVKLQSQLGKLDRVEESMDEVVGLTRYLSQTIDDFKNYLKPDQKRETVDLCDIVATSLRFTSHLLMTKNIAVETEMEPIEVTVNKNEIVHVIINLIKNAVDAYARQQAENPFIRISVLRERNHAVLNVSDGAGGIDAQKLPRIFDEYFSTKGDEGTGLGLYMSKKIVEERHHGELHACNENGGVRFELKLPL